MVALSDSLLSEKDPYAAAIAKYNPANSLELDLLLQRVEELINSVSPFWGW